MPQFVWTDQYNIGIEEIDRQHRKIVDYINQLDDAQTNGLSRIEVAQVIMQLKDYTHSHFSFEENMLNEANYELLNAHKSTHARFIKRLSEYEDDFVLGGYDVSKALSTMLVTWLLNHIKREDADYVESVNAHLKKQRSLIEKFKNLLRWPKKVSN